jgi:hypothetical protein
MVKQKLKEELRGAVISTGAWIVLIGLLPGVEDLYLKLISSMFLGVILIAVGVFWLK